MTARLLDLASKRLGVCGKAPDDLGRLVEVSTHPLWIVAGQPGVLCLTSRTGGWGEDGGTASWALRFQGDDVLDTIQDATSYAPWSPLDLRTGVRRMSGEYRICEAVALAARFEVAVTLEYHKADGPREDRIVRCTWTGNPRSARAPTGYGTGVQFGAVDLVNNAPRTFDLRRVEAVQVRPGQEAPVWTDERGYHLVNDPDPFA